MFLTEEKDDQKLIDDLKPHFDVRQKYQAYDEHTRNFRQEPTIITKDQYSFRTKTKNLIFQLVNEV